jgi:A/G-specific adenine glycosylase
MAAQGTASRVPDGLGARRYPDAMQAERVEPDALAPVRRAIMAWYAAGHRDFPWRGTTDPWAVLVSEVMLQQTQAGRVSERFPAFMARFPSTRVTAAASDREILAAWSGLGYNRRALALRRTAIAVEADGWPSDVAGLERLPGIGPYTARAVAALAFGQPVGAVDTNVRRWLVRRFGAVPDARGATLQALADGLAAPASSPLEAADWMHASMEFGGRICRARSPLCDACPIADGCPSRGLGVRVPVPRQAPFERSDRAVRGAILRELSRAPDHVLPEARLARLLGGKPPPAIVDALERDGLVHRAGEWLRLGPAERAATIEA